jgi:hypothetical protein
MYILSKKSGDPYSFNFVRQCVIDFGKGYNRTVSMAIENSNAGLDKKVFRQNVGMLMPNFLMGRAGPFKGLKYSNGRVVDPKNIVSKCWKSIGEQSVQLRAFIDGRNQGNRIRALVAMSDSEQRKVAAELWSIFKALLPVCMGKHSMGLVGASKVLFSVLPEVALPIDNAEWRHVFKTVDFGDVILLMAEEIARWEKATGMHLDECDPNETLTLPAVYNVMAMKARPKPKPSKAGRG